MYVSVRGRTRRKKAASFGAEDELMGVCRARANTRGQTAPSTTATGKTIKSMAAASMCMETAIHTRSALCPRLLVCVHAGACVSKPRCGSCLPSDGGMFACTHQSHQSHARAHLMGGTRLNVPAEWRTWHATKSCIHTRIHMNTHAHTHIHTYLSLFAFK